MRSEWLNASLWVHTAVLAAFMIGGTHASAQSVREYESNAEGWLVGVNDPQTFAFDTFAPGMTGKGDLTGTSTSIDLGTTTLTVQELGRSYAALRDASSYAQCSDATLYIVEGVGSRWTFSTPIYGLFTYYGSAAADNTLSMRLYADDVLVEEISRAGGGLGTYSVGHGFVSDVPIDRVDFTSVGWDDTVLIGAFVGLDVAETSLGRKFIAGYRGPNGSSVESDFAITTEVPPDFILNSTTLFANQIATFQVEEARPDSRVYLAYSLKGPGETHVGALNVTLDIRKPRHAAGWVVTNSRGEATWQLWMPPAARRRTVWFQAVQMGGVSNVIARQVN